MAREETTIEAAGREVRLTSPSKVVFPARADRDDGRGPLRAVTKRDVVDYYLAVAEPALRRLRDRPGALKRYRDGIARAPFFQKRIGDGAPEWLQTAVVTFPSGRTARELVIQDEAHLVWALQLGVIDLHPWPVRRPDLDRPDELRIDLDPTPEASWHDVRRAALCVREILDEHGLVGWPKTSGSRGIHVDVRIRPEHEFAGVRRAAVALAREAERRLPGVASAKWWKEERRGVFLDFNQNARDRTVAAAWSLRPVPDALVSMPLRWEDVPDAELGDFRIDTVPALLAERGDPHAAIDDHAGSLDGLLELARVDEEERGLPDAPWPPNYPKQPGEPPRVQPSRARRHDR